MTEPHTLEFAAACSDVGAATDLARELGGTLYADGRTDAALPYAALVTGISDDLRRFDRAADIGLYVVCRRLIKAGDAAVYALFSVVHHPKKTHEECDAHWRDVHAPLALEHHGHMTHHVQLSVMHRIRGLDIDGFSLCGFAGLDDLKSRFFTTDGSRDVIARDIEKFADTAKSPRRLIATPTEF